MWLLLSALACTCRPPAEPPESEGVAGGAALGALPPGPEDWTAVAVRHAALTHADLVEARERVVVGLPFDAAVASVSERLGEPVVEGDAVVWYALADGVRCHRLWLRERDGAVHKLSVEPWRCPET